VWWLAVLADRTGLSLDECVTDFLAERQHHLGVEDAS
jgi:hypothetical protein